jgi:hypothetical protein
MLKLFKSADAEPVDDRTHIPEIVANEFIRIAKGLGEADAAAYLGAQRPQVGHKAVGLILARLAKGL